jgi:AcrR family transcriptional regulator
MGRRKGDHDGRREEVARAAWRVIVREGLDRTTIRAVAAELGSTASVVTHYFRTKDHLLRLTLDRLVERQMARIRAMTAGLSGIRRLEAVITAALPVDAATRTGWTIWAAFLGRAVGDRRLAEEQRRRYAQFRAPVREALAECAEGGHLRPGLDLDLEADALVALGDGIGISEVIDPGRLRPTDQIELVRQRVGSLLRHRRGVTAGRAATP